MKRFHHIYFLIESHQQRADFLEIGLKLPCGRMAPRGELVTFDIAEDDPRWERVKQKLAPLQREHKAFDLVMSKPTFQESARVSFSGSRVSNLDWLEGYSGQTVYQLLSLEGRYRTDSLVLAFEQAINQKAGREGRRSLTDVESTVLAVEALERKVNNGGYGQFFINSSPEVASTIVSALQRIDCPKTAKITQRAMKALGISNLKAENSEAAMAPDDKRREKKLDRCDDAYHASVEPIAERLFAFIKLNKAAFRL
jgi:hypothetical protein